MTRVTVIVVALAMFFAGCSSNGESATCERLRKAYETAVQTSRKNTDNLFSVSEKELADGFKAMIRAEAAFKKAGCDS